MSEECAAEIKRRLPGDADPGVHCSGAATDKTIEIITGNYETSRCMMRLALVFILLVRVCVYSHSSSVKIKLKRLSLQLARIPMRSQCSHLHEHIRIRLPDGLRMVAEMLSHDRLRSFIIRAL